MDFDPGDDAFELASSGFTDVFVSKLDDSGNFVLARSMGGSSFDEGRSIAVDCSGNVHTTGVFQQTVDFDPGDGAFELTSGGFTDVFVSKLDDSGNFVWAKSMGGTSFEGAFGIAVDGSGNVPTTGRFQRTVDFDPGVGIFNLSARGTDIFVSKLGITPPVQVEIDIKPGSDPNCFNNNGNGVIPVAILTTSGADGDAFDFGAATVDPFTLALDGAGVRVKGKSNNAGSLEDVDGDGDLDLVVQIADTDGTYSSGTSTATLTGQTIGGTPIQGTDSVCITQYADVDGAGFNL